MSLLILVVAGSSGLLLLNHYNEKKRKQSEVVKKLAKGSTKEHADLTLHTGAYGNLDQISSVLDQPGLITKIENDTDLRGAPIRWIHLRNGGVYKTYNMSNP